MTARTWLLVLVCFAAGAVVTVPLVLYLAEGRGAGGGPEAMVEAQPPQGEGTAAVRDDAGKGGTTAVYQCPMHPNYTSDQPGDCPICGMRLVPIRGETPAHEGKVVAGYATVNIPERRQQSIGVTTGIVRRRRVESSIRTVGRVTWDEERLTRVSTKVSGWVEALHVNRTGDRVRRGAPLLEIYSPELVATQEEYLIARENLARLEASGALASARAQASALLEEAARRLSLWDITADQIQALAGRGAIVRRMTLAMPAEGYVVEKKVVEGQHVSAGEDLMEIADLSRVWILAEIYESQVAGLSVGDEATITLSYLPGRSYRGRIDFIYPWVEPDTRTITVRITVPNEDLSLLPEMYADVRFAASEGEEVLAVPNEAILDTGVRQIAFVSLGEGLFEPRELVIGRRTADATVVLEGLAEGERIVTSGNFLIDSESRLKAALREMGRPTGAHQHDADASGEGGDRP